MHNMLLMSSGETPSSECAANMLILYSTFQFSAKIKNKLRVQITGKAVRMLEIKKEKKNV